MADPDDSRHWVTSWAASVQGPYPVGNPTAQPDQRFIFPSPAEGATDQTFRLIVRPTVWGSQMRLRLANTFGTRAISFDDVCVGLHLGGAAVLSGTTRAVTFGGRRQVTIAAGGSAWSDPVALAIDDPQSPLLAGRKLAISFHGAGPTGPMTWHAKALQTSYVTAPGVGACGANESEAPFPHTTASWFFLDAVDMRLPRSSYAVACFGDSITDGSASTMNGDDRWPDILARQLSVRTPNCIAVVNAGIGGNQIAGPAVYGPEQPYPGGPSARARLDRDVLSLSAVRALIWLEGVNDFSKNGTQSVDFVTATLRDAVAYIRSVRPDMRLITATATSAVGSTNANHGFAAQEQNRQALNAFLRTSKLFDAVVDFDAATCDPATGSLKAEMIPDGSIGGPGDYLHPNRAGYLAMALAIDLDLIDRL